MKVLILTELFFPVRGGNVSDESKIQTLYLFPYLPALINLTWRLGNHCPLCFQHTTILFWSCVANLFPHNPHSFLLSGWFVKKLLPSINKRNVTGSVTLIFLSIQDLHYNSEEIQTLYYSAFTDFKESFFLRKLLYWLKFAVCGSFAPAWLIFLDCCYNFNFSIGAIWVPISVLIFFITLQYCC